MTRWIPCRPGTGPGNVRELQNVIEHAVVLLDPGSEITPDDLPARAGTAGAAPGADASDDGAAADPGAVLVLRRRVLDSLRAELIASWAADPPPADEMLAALQKLEAARAACLPRLEQALAAEFADLGGADLVVEVAHDMRSPLTSILFLAETLHRGQSGPLSDLQKKQIGIVYSASLGLVGLASDMIEVARGGDRLSSRQPIPFSLNETIQSVQDLVGPMAEEKNLELKFENSAASRRLGYPIPLSRVLLNLTTNALKFTQEGSVDVTVRNAGATRVEFAVRDSGPGINPESMEYLYLPFKRESSRRSGYYFSGTGLGLAICRRLVAAMGAELRLETERGVGTRFSFELDLPAADLL
jgi:signal transduction histidine kinase